MPHPLCHRCTARPHFCHQLYSDISWCCPPGEIHSGSSPGGRGMSPGGRPVNNFFYLYPQTPRGRPTQWRCVITSVDMFRLVMNSQNIIYVLYTGSHDNSLRKLKCLHDNLHIVYAALQTIYYKLDIYRSSCHHSLSYSLCCITNHILQAGYIPPV